MQPSLFLGNEMPLNQPTPPKKPQSHRQVALGIECLEIDINLDLLVLVLNVLNEGGQINTRTLFVLTSELESSQNYRCST